jgi:hypothetical protein
MNCRHKHRTSEEGDYNKQKQKKKTSDDIKPKFCRPGQESHDARDMHMYVSAVILRKKQNYLRQKIFRKILKEEFPKNYLRNVMLLQQTES